MRGLTGTKVRKRCGSEDPRAVGRMSAVLAPCELPTPIAHDAIILGLPHANVR